MDGHGFPNLSSQQLLKEVVCRNDLSAVLCFLTILLVSSSVYDNDFLLCQPCCELGGSGNVVYN